MATFTKTQLILFSLMMATVAGTQETRSEPFATAFTYQAQLNEGSGPLNGSADLRFKLFAVEDGGTPVSSTITLTNQTVTDGLVAERLDFGVDVFDGGSRWLEVEIRSPHDPTDTAPFTTLSPRQAISPIPYALQTRGIFVDEAGIVSIGAGPVAAKGVSRGALPAQAQANFAATVPGRAGLLGESTATTGDSVGIKGKTASLAGRGIEGTGPGEGVRGEATSTTGDVIGIKGITASLAGKGIEGKGPGTGILGHATATTGTTTGVHGKSDSPDGEGIRGEATAGSGVTRGVCGISVSTTGEGVMGHASALSGATTGVKGVSDSPTGIGVVGEGDSEGVRGVADAAAGTARGVCGISASTTGEGVLGHASAVTGSTTGVKGVSDSPTGTGVVGQAVGNGVGVIGQSVIEGIRGQATATSGTAQGVCGISLSTSGDGVFGHATSTTGAADGVHGKVNSGSGRGVFGEAPVGGFGVWGETAGTGAGVIGVTNSSGIGVEGRAPDTIGQATGVSGYSNSPEGRGVFGKAPNEGVRGELNSIGPAEVTAFGVLGRANGTKVAGVYGEINGIMASGPKSGYGVHGRAVGIEGPEGSAGVLAEGDGTEPFPSGPPRAAALEIRNGAIRVSGDARPAGTIVLPAGGWVSIQSCDALSGPPGHSHTIGFQQDVPLLNDLIVDDSIILATVELNDPEGPTVSYSVYVREKHPGQAVLRVTTIGMQGGACPPPSGTITRSVHYLIINPCGTPAECDANPRSTQR